MLIDQHFFGFLLSNTSTRLILMMMGREERKKNYSVEAEHNHNNVRSEGDRCSDM